MFFYLIVSIILFNRRSVISIASVFCELPENNHRLIQPIEELLLKVLLQLLNRWVLYPVIIVVFITVSERPKIGPNVMINIPDYTAFDIGCHD